MFFRKDVRTFLRTRTFCPLLPCLIYKCLSAILNHKPSFHPLYSLISRKSDIYMKYLSFRSLFIKIFYLYLHHN